MSKQIYNADTIESIKIVDKKECLHFSYLPYKKRKNIFHKDRLEGFYYSKYLDDYSLKVSEEEIKNGFLADIKLLVIDNVVYYRPYVEIFFLSGNKKVITFETYQEVLDYATNIAKFIDKQLIFD